jgi:CHAT domain-containing protein
MEFRSGRASSVAIAPLLILLAFSGSAAAPSAAEKAYRAARAIADRGDLSLALDATNAALKARGAADDEWTAALRILRGELLIKRGSYNEGRAIVEPELPRRLQTSEAAVRRLLALGIAAANASDTATARKLFTEALRLAEAHQPKLVFDGHVALMNIAPSLEAAERDARIATKLARKNGNELGLAIVNNALSFRYSNGQRYAEGIALGEDAIRGFHKLGVQGRLSSACGNLGWPYLELGDSERAADLFTCAIDAAKKAGNQDNEITWANHLGNLQFIRRHFADAEREYQHALDAARELKHRETPVILTNLARVAVETRRFADATRFNSEALRLKRGVPKNTDEINSSLIIDARIAMYSGDTTSAERTLRSVISTPASDQKASTRWEAQARLAQLYVRLKRNADADASFRSAMDTVADARADLNSAELRLSFLSVATDVFGSYVDYLAGLGRIEEALAVTEEVRAQTLEEGATAKPGGKKIVPQVVAGAHGATILSYWVGVDRSYVWSVTAQRVTMQPLPAAAEIETAVEKYRRQIDSRDGTLQRIGENGAALYRMLVAPALPNVPRGSRVIIIPDGALHAINFETLVVGSPRHYWIEDAILSSAASLQLLARGMTKGGEGSMLLIGNPPPSDPAFPPLLHAQEEIDRIAGHFARTTKLTGLKATPAAYQAASPEKFDFVHFVAHGVATRIRPLDSAVILGRDASREYHLFARDIVKQPLKARLVTISSCHGAGTRIYAGEGLVGLAWAFLRAGAGNVVAALWQVDDSATPALMDRMYTGIRAGRDPAAALRDAKLVLVHSQGAYKRPSYWAPFVLYSGS